MTESPVDVAALRADHQACHGCSKTEEHCLGCAGVTPWPCLPLQLADALDRAQAASEGVDLLIAQAERRGAVKALRRAAGETEMARSQEEVLWNVFTRRDVGRYLMQRADVIESGADL